MNIQEYIVTSANWTPGRQGNAVTGIVLHTMVGTAASAQSRFDNPSSQVSVHYGVSLAGDIYKWVSESDTAWQAGNWGVNLNTIGIEHEDDGNYNDSVRTDAEYESSSDLVADICNRYGFPADTNHIFLHKNVSQLGTSCPDGLDTNRIISMAAAKLAQLQNPTPAPAPLPITPSLTFEPITPKKVQTIRDASLWDLSFTSYPDAHAVEVIPSGTELDIVATVKHPLGSTYYITEYSYSKNIFNGVNEADCEDVPVAPPAPGPTPVTEAPSVPTTTPEPVSQPDPVQTPSVPATPGVSGTTDTTIPTNIPQPGTVVAPTSIPITVTTPTEPKESRLKALLREILLVFGIKI